MMKDKERRIFSRLAISFRVECKHPDCKRSLKGVAENVSMGGACFLVSRKSFLAKNKQAFLSLVFSETTLNTQSAIVWQKKAGNKNKIGMRFLSSQDSFKDNIYQQMFKFSSLGKNN